MSFVLFPCYQDIYDDKLPQLKELIAEIPSEMIVSVVSDINARKYINPIDFKIDFEVFNLLIGRLSGEKVEHLNNKLKDFVLNVQAQVCIFPLQQMLQLAEFSLLNYVKKSDWSSISPEQEENILKAVLVLNTQNQSESLKMFRKEERFDSLETFMRVSWPFMIDDIELYNKDNSQIPLPLLQSIMLFDYLENDAEFKAHFKKFLQYYTINNYKDYLGNILSLLLHAINKEQKLFVSFYETTSLENSPVLKNFIREIDETTCNIFKENRKFFSVLREKPFFKTSIGKSYLINWGFIADKIYEGLKYDFYENSGISKFLEWGTYSSKLGKFNEKIIFDDMVRRYLQRPDTVCYFENIDKGWNQDLYHRKDNHICFIEFKGGKLPMKSDFESIKTEIDKKMIGAIDSKGKYQKKAIYQLIDQIKDFHDNINKFENINFARERLFIYPIILFTDPLWKLPGINEYLGKLFKEEVMKLNLKFFHIEELVLIHLDYFYINEKAFLKNKINLHELIFRSRLVKQRYQDIAKKAPNDKSVTDSYYNFEFYASEVVPDSYTFPLEQSIFQEVIKLLELPES